MWNWKKKTKTQLFRPHEFRWTALFTKLFSQTQKGQATLYALIFFLIEMSVFLSLHTIMKTSKLREHYLVLFFTNTTDTSIQLIKRPIFPRWCCECYLKWHTGAIQWLFPLVTSCCNKRLYCYNTSQCTAAKDNVLQKRLWFCMFVMQLSTALCIYFVICFTVIAHWNCIHNI